jgi:hypothetical protein
MTRQRAFWIIATLIIALLGIARAGAAAPRQPAAAPLGSAFSYQGRLVNGGVPASGSYDFTFRLYDAAAGGAQIGGAVTLNGVAVAGGLFMVQLDFGPGAFGGARWLEITVGGVTLSPRQPLTAAPAALYAAAAPWSGLSGVPADLADGDDDTTYTAGKGLALNGTSFEAKGSPLANTVIVARSGGDFSSVQAAIDSIAGAGPANPYTVFVATGVYTEQVTLKPYVHLRGAGQGATVIRWGGGTTHPQDDGSSATVRTASNSSLADLTVESGGNGLNVGIYNRDAAPLIRDVTVAIVGVSGGQNFGIYNYNAAVQISDATITITTGYFSFGVYSYAASNVKLIDTMISVSQSNLDTGILSAASTTLVRGSTVQGDASVDRSSGITQIAHSQMIGTLTTGIVCIGNYNINLAPINCP